jgi:hypothetical protein
MAILTELFFSLKRKTTQIIPALLVALCLRRRKRKEIVAIVTRRENKNSHLTVRDQFKIRINQYPTQGGIMVRK